MKPKKSLGQHFLHSQCVIDDIVVASKISPTDTILEIGPGEGVLTTELIKTGAHVMSVEKDDRLIPELQKKFIKEISTKQFELIHADVLDLGLSHIIEKPYKLVANIPYYITGQIIRMFLESDHQPTHITLLVQKEVAERIVARDGKESLLSLSVKVFGNPKYIRTVGKGAFTPPPTVDSAVLTIENISKEKLDTINAHFFFKVLHAGFSHKRKQLLPNLTSLFEKETLIQIFKKVGLNEKCRAEDMHVDIWIQLCNSLPHD